LDTLHDFTRPDIAESDLKSNLDCHLGDFDSSSHGNVVVTDSIGTTFNCRKFGEAFGHQLKHYLRQTRFCRSVSGKSSNETDLTITGKLEEIDIVNHRGFLGNGPTASGLIRYRIHFREALGVPDITNEVSVDDVLYPGFNGTPSFSLAIDAMRITLAAKTATEITNLEQMTKLARAYPLQDDPKPSLNTEPSIITITSPYLPRSLKIIEKGPTITVAGTARFADGVTRVTVNGQEARLDEDGNFWAEVPLRVGKNKITVVATDTHKKKATKTFTVVREAEQIPQATAH
jgi:Glucodextranase, domain B